METEINEMAPEEHVTEEQQDLLVEEITGPVKRLPVVNLFEKTLLLEKEVTAKIVSLAFIKKWKKYQLTFEYNDEVFSMALSNQAFNQLVVKFGENPLKWKGQKFTMTGKEFHDPKGKVSDGIRVEIR